MAAVELTGSSGQTTDRQLIELTLAGDADAYARIVERYQQRIYRVALAIVRNDIDADGVTQDTFVQAYLNLARFEGRSELETWLTRIAINRSRDALRARRWPSFRAQNSTEESTPEAVDERPDAERQVAGQELLGAIEKAASLLSEKQRTIFRLRHYEDLPLERIAELMGLRPATVRVHLFRAVHKIRKQLAHWWPSIQETLK